MEVEFGPQAAAMQPGGGIGANPAPIIGGNPPRVQPFIRPALLPGNQGSGADNRGDNEQQRPRSYLFDARSPGQINDANVNAAAGGSSQNGISIPGVHANNDNTEGGRARRSSVLDTSGGSSSGASKPAEKKTRK